MLSVTRIILACLLVIQLIEAKNIDPFSRGSLEKKIKSPISFGELVPQPNYGLSFCKTCIDFAEEALSTLLNAVINVGVIGECSTLCSYVANKTSSEIVTVVCNVLCDLAGIDEFIRIIEKADLDPIWYCEMLKSCPINDHGDATITYFEVVPQQGPQGPFTIGLSFDSKNGTGTGELYVSIKTIDKVAVRGNIILEAVKPGRYNIDIKLNAVPDPDCNPTQEPCEKWLQGDYIVQAALCNGECGSHHPHSQIYDQGIANFTII